MVNRVVLGAHAGTYVLRVSRPGYNVLNDSIPLSAVAFDSRWGDDLRIYQQGTFAVPSGNSGEVKKVVNWPNLTYVPAVLFTYQTTSDNFPDIRRRGANTPVYVISQLDGLYVYYDDDAASGSLNINYVCLMGEMT